MIAARGPSQVLTVWLTYQVTLPAVAVEGVGAVAVPVPPVGVLYHNRLVPVAVKAPEAAPWQYATGLVTAGAAGRATIFTITGTLTLSPHINVCVT